jgi:spoIIIJ-associated protein
MEYAEAEGNSIDEAIERALQQLGVERERVDVEIIANATKGLFGLGGKKARVRATLRNPISLHEPAGKETPSRAIETPAAAPRSRDAKQSAPARSASAPREKARPQRTRRSQSDGRPADDIDPATLEHARAVLERTVQLIGTEAKVRTAVDELGTTLVIEGDDSGILIGRRGQTLDALEYVINRVASRDTRHTTHLVVDSHGYRQRRRESLEELAQRMGERAEERGKPVTMNPMSPRDRRIVHLALQDKAGLETRSSGDGYFRKLLIIPAGRRR